MVDSLPQIPHQESIAEMRQAPLRKNAFEIDLKNPVIVVAGETSWKVSGVFKTGEKADIHIETAEKIGDVLTTPEKKAFLQTLIFL